MLPIKNQKQFESIFNEYWEAMYQAAYVRVRDQAITEDIVQEVFIDVWQRKESISIQSSLKAYLLTAVKYKVLKHFNSLNKASFQTIDSLELVAEENEDLEKFEMLYNQLEVAIDKLSPKCRLIFRLHKIEGLSTEDIAVKLNLSKQTIHNQLSKSLAIVRNEMKHAAPILLALLNT
ncbi:sigma-70 family RNA polymerase sigma factor [Belliella kenyensis]|uniref:Sigma-70 family RNA polymerase sigma factor n=1 Tax=Belliella kenyensis TaxID=1472724 RepID=A0ABV8EIT1_9BACT|nr:sigma-70 family RNA polymerase sigma factor [Belliella kenyensis]MCH7400314.1 sigma-70 family RNA polymerase sigma factor [Belliella kenyensis]MDN3604668.1 sigma-70 family RNA polymerase sigma factor [Belliella kenyensis]